MLPLPLAFRMFSGLTGELSSGNEPPKTDLLPGALKLKVFT
jgi:hypothetical protein